MRVEITPSEKPDKKMKARFYKGDKKVKTVHFGQAGASDYTIHGDAERKERYIERHNNGRENWSDPTSAGALSRYILWNKKTLSESIIAFKKRFLLT